MKDRSLHCLSASSRFPLTDRGTTRRGEAAGSCHARAFPAVLGRSLRALRPSCADRVVKLLVSGTWSAASPPSPLSGSQAPAVAGGQAACPGLRGAA